MRTRRYCVSVLTVPHMKVLGGAMLTRSVLTNSTVVTGLTLILCAVTVCTQETSRPKPEIGTWVDVAGHVKSQGPGVNGPHFEGTWSLQKSSNPREPAGEVTLVIQHNDPEVKINRVYKSTLYTREEALTYYTDERGEENIETVDRVKSKTKWEGNNIVSRSATKGFGNRFDGFRTVTWQISKDGNSIKETTEIRSTISNPVGLMRQPHKTTQTFVRVP